MTIPLVPPGTVPMRLERLVTHAEGGGMKHLLAVKVQLE